MARAAPPTTSIACDESHRMRFPLAFAISVPTCIRPTRIVDEPLEDVALLRAAQRVGELVGGEEDDPGDRERDAEDRADERDGGREVGVHEPLQAPIHRDAHDIQHRRPQESGGEGGNRDDEFRCPSRTMTNPARCCLE